jgi:Xaa-Pro aminopeptidase
VWFEPCRSAVSLPFRQPTNSSPSDLQAVKNEVELGGMRACHLRDAVALAEFFLWIEGEIAAGNRVTEVSAATKVLTAQRCKRMFQFFSFFNALSSRGACL